MKKRLLFILFLLMFFVPVVNAETFNNSIKNYNIEKVNTACVSNYINDAHMVALIDGKILFTDQYDENYVFVKKDGSCDTNVSMEDVIEGRKKLGYLHTFAKEENGKYYAFVEKYSIPVFRFDIKDKDDFIELSHYDRETLEEGLTCYKREVINGDNYVSSFLCSEGNENEIFSYYYEKPGDYEILDEIISEINYGMYGFFEDYPGGKFLKAPRGTNVFYLADKSSGKMVMTEENYLKFVDIDDFAVLDDNLFFKVEDNVAKISDGIHDYVSYNNVNSVEVIDSDDFYDLVKITDTNDNDSAYILSYYEVADLQNDIYFDGDFVIKYTNDLSGLVNIKINNVDVPSVNYTINNKTGELTLKESYIDTLPGGNNKISLIYNNGIIVDFDFAIYEPIEVTLDANGGLFSNSKDKWIFDDWSYFNIYDVETPIRDGYKFLGFFTNKDTGGLKLEAYNEMGFDNDVIFYARWEKIDSTLSGEDETIQLDAENPKTSDDIGNSIFVGTISLIGLVGATIYLKIKIK